jgi:RNA-binding protein
MKLSNEEKKHYRSIGHDLNPVVTIAGNGLSEGVLTEIDRALNDHELIKVKVAVGDRETRAAVISELCEVTQATDVQQIGKVVLLLREAKKPNAKLSNIR